MHGEKMNAYTDVGILYFERGEITKWKILSKLLFYSLVPGMISCCFFYTNELAEFVNWLNSHFIKFYKLNSTVETHAEFSKEFCKAKPIQVKAFGISIEIL